MMCCACMRVSIIHIFCERTVQHNQDDILSLASISASMRMLHYFLVASSDIAREKASRLLQIPETIARFWTILKKYDYGLTAEFYNGQIPAFGVAVKFLRVLREVLDLNCVGVQQCIRSLSLYEMVFDIACDILRRVTEIANSLSHGDKQGGFMRRCSTEFERIMDCSVDIISEVIREVSSLTFFTNKSARLGNTYCRTRAVRFLMEKDPMLLFKLTSLLAYDARICLHGIKSFSARGIRSNISQVKTGASELDNLRIKIVKLLGTATIFLPSGHYNIFRYIRQMCVKNMVTMRESLISDILHSEGWSILKAHLQDQLFARGKLITDAKGQSGEEGQIEVVEDIMMMESNDRSGTYLLLFTNLRFYISRPSTPSDIRRLTKSSLSKWTQFDFHRLVNSLVMIRYEDIRAVYQGYGGQDLVLHRIDRQKDVELVMSLRSMRLGVVESIVEILRRYCTDDLGKPLVDPPQIKKTKVESSATSSGNKGKSEVELILERRVGELPKIVQSHLSRLSRRSADGLGNAKNSKSKKIVYTSGHFFDLALLTLFGQLARREPVGEASSFEPICFTDVFFGSLTGQAKTTLIW
eukprot:CAMPEP_0114513760 /NCGR_PEP_ID=MMETSP0109-20121206/15768_1 /TAXON_ID=29199 /ORGANISM="Chlorarachnion reptans, Strain CCCM449" /LENGTH=583 /DNA_ID=CAMNT_0001693707 /DNA_START=73 /DNA_END=1821 /DNA_ORIENTATION=+